MSNSSVENPEIKKLGDLAWERGDITRPENRACQDAVMDEIEG